jgi:hypothetical protein
MEADISILRKTGHFYFALTARCHCWVFWLGLLTVASPVIPGRIFPPPGSDTPIEQGSAVIVAFVVTYPAQSVQAGRR